MEAKTLRTKSCSAKDGGDESLNKSNFSLHNFPLIFHKQPPPPPKKREEEEEEERKKKERERELKIQND